MATILVFDDDRTSAEGVRSLLSSAGFKAVVRHNVAEVGEALDEHQFDLALIDMVLHQEDASGLDVLDEIAKRQPSTHLVVLTTGGPDKRHQIATALTIYPVSGGISKDSDIAGSVSKILAGEQVFDPEIEVFRPPLGLDPSEELMRTAGHQMLWVSMAKGNTGTRELAADTRMSRKYVRNCIGQMAAKLRTLGLVTKDKVTISDLAAYAATHRDYFLKWRPR